MRKTALVLLWRPHRDACRFEHGAEMARGGTRALTLAGNHVGGALEKRFYTAKTWIGGECFARLGILASLTRSLLNSTFEKPGFKGIELGVGGLSPPETAGNKLLAGRLDARGFFVVGDEEETDPDKMWTLSIHFGQNSVGNDVLLMRGQVEGQFPGCRSFVMNTDGTLLPKNAPHLVVGFETGSEVRGRAVIKW